MTETARRLLDRRVLGRRLPGRGDDRGSLTLFAVVWAFGLLLVTGLVLDGGAQLTAQRRADYQAEQAARVGAQAVDTSSLRGGGPITLQPALARAAAAGYLRSVGYGDPQVTVTAGRIEVRVGHTQPTSILSLIGRPSITVTGVGRAVLLTGNHSQERS